MVFVFQRVMTENENEQYAKKRIEEVKQRHAGDLKAQISEISRLRDEANAAQQGRQYYIFSNELVRLKKQYVPSGAQPQNALPGATRPPEAKRARFAETADDATDNVLKYRSMLSKGEISRNDAIGALKAREDAASASSSWQTYWIYFSARIQEAARLNVDAIKTHPKSSRDGELLRLRADAQLKAARATSQAEKEAWLEVAKVYGATRPSPLQASEGDSAANVGKRPAKEAIAPQKGKTPASAEKKPQKEEKKPANESKKNENGGEQKPEQLVGKSFESLMSSGEISSAISLIGVSREKAEKWARNNWARIRRNASSLMLDRDSGRQSVHLKVKDEHGRTHNVSLAPVSSEATDLELAQACILVELYREFFKSVNPHVKISSDFYHAIFRVESGYNRRAYNPSGATGIGQLLPESIISFDAHERGFLSAFGDRLVNKWAHSNNGANFTYNPSSKDYSWRKGAFGSLSQLHKGVFFSMLHMYANYLKLEEIGANPTEYHIAEKYNAGNIKSGMGDDYAAEVRELTRRKLPGVPLSGQIASSRKRR